MAFLPEQYIYSCPFGCKNGGVRPIAATVRGWKKHMTGNHEGWTEEQLQAAIGSGHSDVEAGRAAFVAEADNVIGIDSGAQGTDRPAPEPPSPERLVQLRTDAASKKLSAKMNKIKRDFAEKIPQMLNAALKAKGEEWVMDDGDSSMLAESVESCFDMLDINFQIAPVGTTLKSPLWVLIYPLAVLAVIFILKAVKNGPIAEPAP